LKGLYLLARLDGESNRHARAISLLERFIAIDPYHDEVYCQLMDEHLALGDAVSASRTYKRYIEGVAREMDCLPSARMRDLHLRLFTRTPGGN
jgi:DNA-binding SARP family transcriptional activator